VDLSNPLSLTQYPSIMEQLKKSGINSLENLDNLLLNMTDKNNHCDSLFIVRDKSLVIFMIKLVKNSAEVLQQFYKNAPFMIIPIDTITNVKKDCIIIHNEYNREYIYFSSCIKGYYAGERNWLHERLMSLNEEYRYKYVRIFVSFLLVGNMKNSSIRTKNNKVILYFWLQRKRNTNSVSMDMTSAEYSIA
jgi:hypothetical protein